MSKYRQAIRKAWSCKPSWANFIAIDRDGEIWAFEFKPGLTKRKNWRSRIPDGRAKFLKSYEATGYFGTVCPEVYDETLKPLSK